MKRLKSIGLAVALVAAIAPVAHAQSILSITTTSPLPPATTGVPYTTTLTATQSSTWSILAPPSLPAGLTIGAGPGTTTTISGTPTVSCDCTFTVKVNAAGISATKLFSLSIASTTTLSSSLSSPSVFGKSLTLTAQVTPSSATGPVIFYNGSNQIGAGVLTAGRATFATQTLPAGANKLTALYLGDGTNTASPSPVLSQVVHSVAQSGFRPPVSYSNAPAVGSSGDPGFVAFGDFDEDGKVDVAAANFQTGNISVFKGANNGTFGLPTVVAVGNGPFTLAVGDLNADGHLDLVVANFATGSNTVSVLLGTGTGSFAAAVNYPTIVRLTSRPSAVAIGDIDGDGIPDIAIANYSTNNVSVLIGIGDGTFNPVTAGTTFAVGTNPYSIVLGDFNGDGKTDIATANNGSSNFSVLINNGAGFAAAANASVSGAPVAIVSADFDGDGKLDLALASSGGTVSVLRGAGDGTFTGSAILTAGTSPNYLAAGDFNGDGVLDLVTSNIGSNDLSVFIGNGTGTFGTATTYILAAGDTAPYGVGVADLNNDGISDLFTANFPVNTVDVFLGLAATSTNLNISSNPVQFTDLTNFTATVTSSTGAVPTGIVTFFDNGIQILSPAALNSSGVATLSNVASGSVGTHPITATYGGDTANATSTSASTNLVVNKDTTTTTVSGNPNPSTPGANVTLTATVVPQVGVNVATGTVQFRDGGTNLGAPQNLSGGGVGTFITAALAAGSHSITAVYSGDINDQAGTSLAVTENILTSTSTTLSSSRNPAAVNQTVTLTAQISAPGGTGTITFKDGATAIGSPVAPDGDTGLASIQTSFSTPGTHNLTATYSGDSTYATSQGGLSQNIVPATTTTLSASPATAYFGQVVALTATVNPSSATGTVVFFDGATILGSATLDVSGSASLSTPLIGSGARKLRALYSGSASSGASASALVSKTISVRPQAGFGSGTFYSTGPQTVTSVVGDFNGDGKQDLAVLDFDFTAMPEGGVVSVLLGNGDGTFRAASTPHISVGFFPDDLAVGDFNGDGKPDLALADDSNGLIILTGDGAGNFTPGAAWNPNNNNIASLAVADFNNDGIADVLFSANGGAFYAQGVGDGTFVSPVNLAGAEAAPTVRAADMNSDGNADMLMLVRGGSLTVALGNGDGTFQPASSYSFGSNLSSLDIADFSGDGNPDVIVASNLATIYYLPGNSDGTLGAPVSISVGLLPVSVAAGDFNGDGKLDIGVADGADGNIYVIPGQGNGNFGAPIATPTGLSPIGLTVGDFSGGTGRSDIVFPVGTDDVVVMLGLPPNVLLGCPTGSTPVVLGVPYNLPCAGSNGVAPYTYSQPTGSLPPGLTLNTSTGAISGTPLQTGSFPFTVKAVDNDLPAQSLTVNVTLNVQPTLVMTSSPLAPGTLNSPYANTLVSGGTTPYTCGLTSGGLPPGVSLTASTCIIGGTPTTPGLYTFTIGVSDSGAPPQNGSQPYSLTIQQLATTTGLTSSVNPSSFGTSTTLTATVTPVGATGNVTFKDGATALGAAVNLVSGVATFNVANLSVTSHSLTAVYNGDTNNAVSTSTVVTQTVNQVTTTTTLTTSQNPSIVNQNLTLTAAISPAGATGTVTFKDGSTVIGSPATISSGSASVSTSTLTAGSHPLTATYNGDTNDATSTSLTVSQLVRIVTGITLTPSPTSSVYGQPVTLTASVVGSAPVPSGKVTFFDGATILGTGTLSGNVATLTTPLLASGTRSLQALYQGDNSYAVVKTSPAAFTVGTFAESGLSAASPFTIGPNTWAVAVGDFDGDGIEDIVAGNYNGNTTNQVAVLLGKGSGSFQPAVNYSTGSPAQAVAVADVNNDGLPDLVLATPGTNSITVLLNTGSGIFGSPTTFGAGGGPQAIAIADFNGDGIPDVVSGNTGNLTVLLGNGDGTFQASATGQVTSGPTYVTAADFNSDGNADIAAVDGNGTVYVLFGTGNGTFLAPTTYSTGVSPISINTADFNHDGNPDVILGDDGIGVKVLMGSANGALGSAVNYPAGNVPGFVSTGDFNGDGKLDMAVADVSTARVSILAGNGDGTFQAKVDYPTASPTFALATGNFQGGNGRADLVVGYGPAGDIGVLLGQIPQVSLICTPGAPPVLTNVTYTISCSGSGGVAPFTYSQPTGTLPPGLTLTTSTGVINGQPATAGTYIFSIQAADSDTPVQTASTSVTVTVVTPLIMSATPLASGIVNTAYSTTVASGGTPPYTCGLSTGAYPTGLTMDAAACVLSGIPTVPGTYSFTVGVSDNGSPQQNNSRAFSLTIQQVTTTTLTSSVNPSTFNSSTTLTATVAPPSAGGTVTFQDGVTVLGGGPVALSGGVATLGISSLAVGAHSLTAVYNGDASDLGSTSPIVSQTVKAATTTTISASPVSPSTFGAATTLTATVARNGTPGNATGKVTFYNGTTVLGTSTIASGQASFTTSLLPGAVDKLQAYYAGDGGDNPSSSTVLTQTVNAITEGALRGPVAIPGTSSQPSAMAIGDFNHDGIADLVTADSGGAVVTVLLGTGGGAYTRATYPVGNGPSSVAIADFNGDGFPDLAVANLVSNTVSILLGVGDGTFGLASPIPVAGNPVSVAVGDFNQDGFADLAVVSNSTNNASVLPGNGDGTFGAAAVLGAGAGPVSVAVGDFNSDGFADLVIANKGDGSLIVLPGNGLGAFGEASRLTTGGAPASVIVADFNNDGHADLAVANSADGTIGVFYGDGNSFGAMTPQTAGNGPVSLAAGDFNGDGKTDLAVSNAGDSTIQVFLVNSGGQLGSGITYPSGTNPVALAAADLNGDGRTDLAVADTGGSDQSIFLGLAVSTTTLTSSANPSTFGDSVTFTATVTPPGATGTVTFNDGGTSIGTGTVTSGTAALASPALVAGAHSITATYGGDNNNAASTSVAFTQNVNKAASATMLTSSLNPSTFGAPVTFTATVSAGATGTVTFLDGASSIGTGTVSGGTATLAISNLPVATHSITASYGGDSNFLSSVSSAVNQVVNKVPTTTTLTAAPNPSTFGQTVTLTATLAPSTATGTVTFFDGSTSLGSGALSGGTATFAISTLSVGAHSLTASYPGDTNDTSSVSLAVTQTVNKASTTTTLTSGLNPSAFQQNVTFTATVAQATATGTVTFFDGATSIGTGTITSGTATLTLSTLAGGAHFVTASYGGDASFNGSVSSAVSQTVNPLATTTGLTSSVNPSTSGQSITLTATVSQAAATGTVTFKDGPTTLGTASVGGGIAKLSTNGLDIGSHLLEADYGGDANYAASGSQLLPQTVRTPATITISSSQPGGFTLGSAVILTATVTPGSATGTVTFFDGVTILGTAAIANGQASLTTRLLPSGTRSLSAFYVGSAAYGPAGSSVVPQQVTTIPQFGFAANANYTVGPNTPATAVADFNGDGFPDLVVADFNGNGFGQVNILLNNGDGTFQAATGYSAGGPATSMAIGDFNSDGVPDIVTAVPTTSGLNVMLSDAQGIPGPLFFVSDANGPQSVVVGDFNGDGNADLAAGNADGTVTIFVGSGQGSFVPRPAFGSGSSAASLVVADFNNDRIADLGVTDEAGFHVLIGNGDGSFTPFFDSPFTGGLSAAVGDFNSDGNTDVVIAAGLNAVVLAGNGDGTFGSAVSYSAGAGSNVTTAVIGDFNGDGQQDFATGDINTGGLLVFPGDGNGGFNQPPSSYHGAVVGLSVADFNGDGRADIVAGNGTSSDAGVFLGAPAVPGVFCPSQNLPAILGSPYSLGCGATGGVAPYTFSISSGALPDGLSVDPLAGTISGTPSVAGSFSFTLQASDSQAIPETGSLELTIIATTQLTLTSSLPGGNISSPYSFTLAAGGTTPYTCSLTGGSLPPGLTVDAATCILGGTPTALGSFPFTISAADAGAPVQNASQSYAVQISQFASTTVMTASPNPSVIGQTVTLNITVTGATPAGNVTIKDGAATIGVAALTSGVAQAQFSSLTIGSHSLTATYPGDTNDTASTSQIVTQVVNQIATTTALTSSLNPSTFGATVTFTANVSPPTATGTVSFKDGGTTVGSGNVNGNGVATLVSSTIPVGVRSLTATYNGDANDSASTTTILSQTVNKAATTTSLTSSLNPSHFGDNVTLTATVSQAAATGIVTFSDGSTQIGTGNLNASGVATLTLSTLSVGAHSLTASYGGDVSFLSSTSTVTPQTVNTAVSTTTLTSLPNPTTFGQQVTMTITVNPSSATGTVTVSDRTAPVGSPVALVNGSATIIYSNFSVGQHSLTASYEGDTNDAPSTSVVATQTVNLAPTITILTSSLNPSLPNQVVTFTAIVSGAGANGSVTFSDGGSPLGDSVGYDGAPVSFTTSSLAPGPHTITASYSGDSSYAGSVSSLIRSPLNFSAAAPGTIADSNGQGTGFTTRLPGTGGSLAASDTNLTLNTATGTLGLQSTDSNLDGQNNLGAAEYLGLPLSSVGVTDNEDFSVIATFRNWQYSQSVDQIGLFAGPSSTTAFRGGALVFAPTPSVFTAQTVNGQDANLQTDQTLAPAAGDDVTLTMSRTDGIWALAIQDLTDPTKTGDVPVVQPTYLNGLSTLIAGVFAANPGSSPRNETISDFSLAVPVQTVGTIPSTTTLTSSVNPTLVGQSTTLTATVSPSDATGTITFQDDGATLGTGNLDGGVTTLDISTLAFGSHQLTAVYSGDSITAPSTSTTLDQAVNFPTLTITTTSLPGGTAGYQYVPFTLHASGGSGNFTWSATGLPPGILLSADGVLSGSSAAFFGSVNITVTDTTSQLTASQSFPLTVSSPPPPPPTAQPLIISGPTDLGSVPAGGTVSGNFSVSGGTPPYVWSLSDASAGFSVDASGHVTGSPTAVGSATLTVIVTDFQQISKQATATYSVFGFTTTSLPSGAATVNYSASISVAGGTPPYTFSAAVVPAGLTFAAGTVSGKPTSAGNFTMTVQANDAHGLSVIRSFTISVGPAPPPTTPTALQISTLSLPDGTAGQPYSQTVGATGGSPAYTWAQTGGALPAGLSLSPGGTVAGLPSAPGSYSVGVQVTDTSGGKVAAAVAINIRPAPLQITTGAILPSGIATVEYPAQILSATGGVAPYQFSVNGALPSGLSLVDGQISGAPTATGTFNFNLTVKDSAATPAGTTLLMTVTIRPNAADLILSSGAVSFTLKTGASDIPDPNVVAISSSDVTQVLSYTVNVASAPWLNITSTATTPGNISIGLSNAALALASSGSPYSATVVVSCISGACSGKTQSIGVTLIVRDLQPELSLDSELLSFGAASSNPEASSISLGILNAGGGLLKITSVTAADSWISVGALPASVAPGPGASVSITANPGSLVAGFYVSSVNVVTSAGSASIPVTFLISSDSSMNLGPAGAQFSMPQGGALGNPNGSFLVSVSKTVPVNFTASVLPGAPWLHSGNGGVAIGSSPGSVSYSLDPAAAAALPVGAYYGTIRVSASGIVNTPQDFQVVLNVSPASTPVVPDPQPAGLLFLSAAPGPLPPQTIQVFASSKTPLPYQVSASMTDGSGWLSIDSSLGSAVAGTPGQVLASVNSTGLKAGVYRGTVSFSSGSSVRTVNVTLVVEPSTSGATSANPVTRAKPSTVSPAAAGPVCAGATLVATQTGLVSDFSAPASWPTPLAITLVDSCGSIVGNGQIVATFSNGDPPLELSPVDPVKGVYSGTWTPRKSAAQITIAAHATVSGYPAASIQIAGKVTPNAAPQLAPNGTLDVFHPQVGAALGPGNIVQIYGTALASQTTSPQVLPLPTEVLGTQVLIGGVASPLFYVSPGQLNAQIPFELESGKQYQVIVNANGALTTPQPIQLNAGAPSVLQFTSGLIVAQHQDGTLLSSDAPGAPGEFIVLYMSGLGATDIPVPSGQPSPANPPANVLDTPLLTLNGAPVPISFAGLTPTLVGLYQINLQIPSNLADGTYDLAVSQSGVVSNTTSLPVKNQAK